MKSCFVCFVMALSLYSCLNTSSRTELPYLAKATKEGLETAVGDFIPYPQDSTTAVFFLVRHAEKAKGQNPGLTDEGRLRAHRLASILGEAGLEVGFTTAYNRCISTINPLAMRYKLPVVGYEADRQEELIDTLFAKNPGARVLIVGHSNTIPRLLNVLLGEERYENMPEELYDRLFVVFSKGRAQSQVLEFSY